MKVLLTGGSGFLGSHIAELLSARGVDVRALVRRSSDTSFLKTLPGVELFDAALGDASKLADAMVGVDAVIHSAGVVKARNPAEFHEVNAAGTAQLLDAAKKNAPNLKRFVLVSSLAVVGPSKDGKPVAADALPNPVTHYGRSKLAAERAARANKDALPITIVRPPLIYGPRDKEVFVFFQAVKLGILPYMGSTARGMSAIYASDCAEACIAALDKEVASGSAYFVEDGQTETLGELVGHVEQAMGKRAWVRIPIPRRALQIAAMGSEVFGKLSDKAVMLTRDKCNELYAPHWVCDSSETQRDLGWKPKVPFATGARITADWYRKNRWL
ncbi:MAG: hypothetical protein RJA70_695 [Pseudomonadota bacterium]|jgi:nucleoside-diphosphate-sugar epimerase